MAFPTNKTNAVDNTTDVLAAHLNNLEDKVGIDSSADTSSLDYKVSIGWNKISATCTYVGADDPTYTMYIAGDATGYLSAGMKFKCTQTTDRQFFITAVGAYDSGNDRTLITLYGGTDYDLANAAITNPYYSMVKAPQGFPLNPDKWSVETTSSVNVSQDTPSASIWYNLGSLSIDIPVGIWRTSYQVNSWVNDSTARGQIVFVTLSTTTSSETDLIFSSWARAGDVINLGVLHSKEDFLNLSTKDTYYLLAKSLTAASTALQFRGDLGTTIIRAECAYL